MIDAFNKLKMESIIYGLVINVPEENSLKMRIYRLEIKII
jgi:hypothetical protein